MIKTDQLHEKSVKLQELRIEKLELTMDLLNKELNTLETLIKAELNSILITAEGGADDLDDRITLLEDRVEDLKTMTQSK
jgi:hypothetical protein